MSEKKDILDTLFDIGASAGKGVKIIVYKIFKIKERYDLEDFFKNAGLTNKAGHAPIQNKIDTTDKSDLYYMSLPDGLSLSSFENYKTSLKEKFNQDLDIRYDNGEIIVEIFNKE